MSGFALDVRWEGRAVWLNLSLTAHTGPFVPPPRTHTRLSSLLHFLRITHTQMDMSFLHPSPICILPCHGLTCGSALPTYYSVGACLPAPRFCARALSNARFLPTRSFVASLHNALPVLCARTLCLHARLPFCAPPSPCGTIACARAHLRRTHARVLCVVRLRLLHFSTFLPSILLFRLLCALRSAVPTTYLPITTAAVGCGLACVPSRHRVILSPCALPHRAVPVRSFACKTKTRAAALPAARCAAHFHCARARGVCRCCLLRAQRSLQFTALPHAFAVNACFVYSPRVVAPPALHRVRGTCRTCAARAFYVFPALRWQHGLPVARRTFLPYRRSIY